MSTTVSPITSVNPATEEVLARFDPFTPEEVEDALDQAQDAFRAWRERSVVERAVPMKRLAALLRERSERYARLITLEMGKPIAEARAEIEKCAVGCDHYAANGARYLADETVETSAQRSIVAFEPLGIVLAVMPWNFPFWQVIRFGAPALMAGNAAVVKHASNVPQCALAIEEVVRDAGFPEGLFRTLLLSGAAVEPIIADARVRAVTLTGSSDTGSRIAELAGRALKKSVLELGGSDPYIVLRDADLDAAAKVGARARNQNTGQSCIAAKRFIAEGPVAADFERRFAAEVAALRVGDPLDEATQIGPLARADLRDALERQVRESVRMGARVVTGGERLAGKGWFYQPTVLADVTEDMPVFREETFGPVAAVLRVRDADDAVRVANDSAYGLGASLWTRDLKLGESLARRIESGSVFVNGMVASDPRLPFGGVKRSGYGRELSTFGIREFTNIQTIWIGPPKDAPPQRAPSE
ncbi:MAG TPA: NAD-dependent succinate-semialdehyde dehydrogenase [Candidatus Limnocylindria bacterium]|nr:NAD-dependent succinate-semialdehyde dehydrogenase [Candidatus Limnocylindria bacterium]